MRRRIWVCDFDRLVEVLLRVERVELRELLGARAILGVERLRGLVRVDRELGLVQVLLVELAELVEDANELVAVGRGLRLLDLQLEEPLDVVVSALAAIELDDLVERLRVRRVELEDLGVEADRLVDLAEVLAGDGRRRVHVLRTLLRVLDEVGEAEDDVDELRPVLLLGVELHQLREETAVVRPLLEGLGVGLRRAGAVVHLRGT